MTQRFQGTVVVDSDDEEEMVVDEVAPPPVGCGLREDTLYAFFRRAGTNETKHKHDCGGAHALAYLVEHKLGLRLAPGFRVLSGPARNRYHSSQMIDLR